MSFAVASRRFDCSMFKKLKIKRLEKELTKAEDGFSKANIVFELQLLKASEKKIKSDESAKEDE